MARNVRSSAEGFLQDGLSQHARHLADGRRVSRGREDGLLQRVLAHPAVLQVPPLEPEEQRHVQRGSGAGSGAHPWNRPRGRLAVSVVESAHC